MLKLSIRIGLLTASLCAVVAPPAQGQQVSRTAQLLSDAVAQTLGFLEVDSSRFFGPLFVDTSSIPRAWGAVIPQLRDPESWTDMPHVASRIEAVASQKDVVQRRQGDDEELLILVNRSREIAGDPKLTEPPAGIRLKAFSFVQEAGLYIYFRDILQISPNELQIGVGTLYSRWFARPEARTDIYRAIWDGAEWQVEHLVSRIS